MNGVWMILEYVAFSLDRSDGYLLLGRIRM